MINKENKLKSIMKYRVARSNSGIKYMEKEMSKEDVIKRRTSMRELLKNTSFCNSANENLDSMRITALDENGMSTEDTKGYDFYIPSGVIKKDQAEFRKIRSMVPFEYLDKRASDFDWNIYNIDVTSSKNLVNNFIVNFEKFKDAGMGLYITSKTKGSGKTMLSCCLLNELSYRYPVSTKFVTVLDFIELTKKSYKGSTEEVDSIYNASVIVLDDLGVQMSKEWVDSVLYRLINDRYNKKRVTIYTSNVEIENLKVDDRVVDRIDSTTYSLNIPEKPIRHEKKKKEKDELLRKIISATNKPSEASDSTN